MNTPTQNYGKEKEDTCVVTVIVFVHYNPMNLYYMGTWELY